MRKRSTTIVAVSFAVVLPLALAGAVRLRTYHSGEARSHISGRLVCHEPSYEFGEVSASRAAGIGHEFLIQNVSDKAVHIVEKSTSCGCTGVEIKNEILPGETAHLTVRANWSDRDGAQVAQALLTTDEETSNRLRFSFTATVVNPVTILPRTLEFVDLDPGPSSEQLFEVKQSSGVSFTVTGVQATDPIIEVRRPTNAPLTGGPGRFIVRVLAPRQARSLQSRITVHTSLGTAHAIDVRVRARGAVQASPSSVFFDRSHRSAELDVSVFDGARQSRLTALISSGARGADGFAVESIAESAGGLRNDRQRHFSVVVRSNGPSPVARGASLILTCGDDTATVPIAEVSSE